MTKILFALCGLVLSNKSGLWGHGRADQNLHFKFLVRVSSGCPIGPIDPI